MTAENGNTNDERLDINKTVNTETKLGTTTFVNDKVAKVVEPPHVSNISSLLKANAMLGAEQNIKAFLSKPIRYSSGAFAATDTGNSVIAFGILAGIAANSNFSVWTKKLAGYYAARFTLVFRLVVNATRFQQGRYILAFCPSGGCGGGLCTAWYQKHATSLRQVVQLPHGEIDLATETEIVLNVPFMMDQVSAPITTFFSGEGLWDLGSLFTRPYSPLIAASGSSVADWTLYLSLEDVELYGAATQSGDRRFRSKATARKRNVNVTNLEQEQMGVGPFETGFRGVSMVSDALTNVPLLSQFTAPVKWASDFAAGICSKFGWSKPSDIAPVTVIKRVIFPNLANFDGADVSHVLALSQENQVDTCAGFSSQDVDEMSFSYMCGIPNYAGTFTFSTTNNSGDLLFTQNLCPFSSSLYGNLTDTGATLTTYGTLPFVASFFQYYRGNLVLKIKFVKTEFHSGRIAIAFFPEIGVTPVATGYDDSAYVNRVILDLRENNEVEFEIPYISTMPYRVIGDPYGYIKVFCVDPLIAPNTVSSSISCIVELMGSHSLEFAVPATNNLYPIQPTATQAGTDRVPTEDVGIMKLGSSPIDDIANAASCIGEKVVSFRSLLKRPNVWTTFSISGVASTSNFGAASIIPSQVSTAVYSAANSAWQGWQQYDLIDIVSQCFALSRGGVRLKFINTDGSSSYVLGAQLVANGVTTGFIPGGNAVSGVAYKIGPTSILGYSSAFGQNNLATVSRPDLTGGIEVQCPQYLVNHSRMVATTCNPSAPGSYFNDIRYGAPSYVVNLMSSANSVGVVFRAGADDFSLGGFVSVPPFSNH